MWVRNQRTKRRVWVPDDDGLVSVGGTLWKKEMVEDWFKKCPIWEDNDYVDDPDYWIAEGHNLANRRPNVSKIKATRS